MRTGWITSPAEKRASASPSLRSGHPSGAGTSPAASFRSRKCCDMGTGLGIRNQELGPRGRGVARLRDRDRVGVNRDDGVDVGRVAAAHRDGHRQVEARQRPSTSSSRARRPGSSASGVPGDRLHTGRRRRDRRRTPAGAGQDVVQVRGEEGQVLRVPGAILEGHVEVALFLPEREVRAPCIEKVNTDGSPRKMAAVPLP